MLTEARPRAQPGRTALIAESLYHSCGDADHLLLGHAAGRGAAQQLRQPRTSAVNRRLPLKLPSRSPAGEENVNELKKRLFELSICVGDYGRGEVLLRPLVQRGQSAAVIRQRSRNGREFSSSRRLCTGDCGESTPRMSRWKTRPLPASRCFADQTGSPSPWTLRAATTRSS
jgi:hypothetical protein